MKEIWKAIKGYDGLYEVSNIGRVKRLAYTTIGRTIGRKKEYIKHYQERFLNPTLCANGYMRVTLSRKGIESYKHVHSIVAEAFLPNTEQYPCVNHKNEVKTDNRVENLEWCSYGYNNKYNNLLERARIQRIKTCDKAESPIQITNVKDGSKMIFKNKREASTFLNVKTTSIHRAARKIRHTCNGYIVDYIKQ